MSNDKFSVERIVKDYTPRLQTFIHRHVNNKEDEEDILQEVFYQLARSSVGLSDPIEKMSAWLFRVAQNAIFNLNRKHREVSLDNLLDDDWHACEELSNALFDADNPTPDTVLLRSMVWNELEAALGELPPEQRDMFEWTVFDCIPVKDISKYTGIPVATLLSRKHYAVRHLRRRLGELYHELIFK